MSVQVILKKPLPAVVPGVVSLCLRNKFTSEHFKRHRPLNRDKYWGRIVEDGEGVIPGRTIARTRGTESIWPGANVRLERNHWENSLKSLALGQVRYHKEVVEGRERSYVSVDRIYHPQPRFVLSRVVSKEDNLNR
ncbi:hypothetical protein ACHWQZ_G010741 [Mnemiopsis leidyi]